MRRIVQAAAHTAAIAALSTLSLSAQPTQTARGTVASIGADTITVTVGDRPLTFVIDAKTVVTASGAGTATRAATAAGKPGPKLAELLKPGEAVEVTYHDLGGKLHAANVRRTRTAGSGGDATKTEISNGTVEAVTASSITITGTVSGGGTFRQSFAIDGETKVVGRGLGTASREKEGKVSAPDLIAVGDRVSVSYHKAGTALHAAEIRVTSK
jgi:hypothetical protein